MGRGRHLRAAFNFGNESNWLTRQLVERSRAYIGEMGEGEAKRMFALADMVLRGPEYAQEKGPQARLRSRIAARHLDDFADTPHMDPTP